MKVKELVDILKELDQELDVTDGHSALHFIEVLPAYYDGCYVKLKQDLSLKNWNIIGAKIESDGLKVKLNFISAEDLTLDCDKDFEFEYTEQSLRYKEQHDKWIKEGTK